MKYKNEETQNVMQWMASNRLYESYLFTYILILSAWVFLGLFTFGFELDGYSQKENLAFNFGYFVILAVGASLTPTIHRLIWGKKPKPKERIEKIIAIIQEIPDIQLREQALHHIENEGGLPPNRWQTRAIVFLACYYLFELFFLSAWVKDLTLVWQPEWVDEIINWVHSNSKITNRLTLDKLFTLSFGERGDFESQKILNKMFNGDKQAFLNSPFGDVALLFHALKAAIFFPMLIAWGLIMWQLLGWTGMNKISPENIGGIKGFLWMAFVSICFIGVLTPATYIVFFTDVTATIGMVMSKVHWMRDFSFNLAFVFSIIGIRLFVGWLFFWKNCLSSLYNKVVK